MTSVISTVYCKFLIDDMEKNHLKLRQNFRNYDSSNFLSKSLNS